MFENCAIFIERLGKLKLPAVIALIFMASYLIIKEWAKLSLFHVSGFVIMVVSVCYTIIRWKGEDSRKERNLLLEKHKALKNKHKNKF